MVVAQFQEPQKSVMDNDYILIFETMEHAAIKALFTGNTNALLDWKAYKLAESKCVNRISFTALLSPQHSKRRKLAPISNKPRELCPALQSSEKRTLGKWPSWSVRQCSETDGPWKYVCHPSVFFTFRIWFALLHLLSLLGEKPSCAML